MLQIYEFKFSSEFYKLYFSFRQRDLTSLENDKSIFSLSDKKMVIFNENYLYLLKIITN